MSDTSAADDGGFGGDARLTPYEIAFGDAGFEAGVFPRLRAEADERGVEAAARERFAFLSVAGEALRELVPPDAPPEALEQHRALLFHAFNFWRFGRRMYLLDAPVARFLVEAAPMLAGWGFALPYPSVYLQLPANLFWASVAPDATPEPVDGFFVTATVADDPLGPPYQRLEALMVLGVRRDRAGFSVIPFGTEVGSGIAAVWAEASGREGGSDFENVLPGGEIAGLYSILTTTEALKLLARAFWYVHAHPADVIPQMPPDHVGEQTKEPPPPEIAWYRVVLGG